MLDLHYWAGLAFKVGQDKPALQDSLRHTKSQLVATETKIVKFQRKIALASTSVELENIKLSAYEEKLENLAAALTNYRRELVEKSLNYVSDHYDDVNFQLKSDDFKINTQQLKALVLVSRDALKRISYSLSTKEVDVRHFLRLKKSMQEYLSLIIMHIAKAGVTPEDIAARRTTHKTHCSN
mmetsp:Transcript_8058/g.15827  ORF Transcript_8058/g.15827 Transcript_8058/m.15827 type:complete len:182 (-) Transcript_8058:4145-4690(-)